MGTRQVISPVRFKQRATTGRPRDNVPQLDDRGFDIGRRPSGWGSTDARGAMVGIKVGATVSIQVVREDIDAGAQLFVTSTDTDVCNVVLPRSGTALNADGDVELNGVADLSGRCAKIQVHYGSTDGPVIAEMEPHVFTERSVPVCVHRCTINGTVTMVGGNPIPATTSRSNAQINRIFQIINAAWATCGIRFVIRRRRTETITFTSTTAAITGSRQGCVQIDNSANWTVQHFELLGTNRAANMINIYFVPRVWNASVATGGVTGGMGTTMVGGGTYGITIADNTDENDLCHELGHVLNLTFFAFTGAARGHADDTAATAQSRDNIWTRRRLMFSTNPNGFAGDGKPGYLTNAGYGNYARGFFITMKNLRGDPADGETREARRRARGSLP